MPLTSPIPKAAMPVVKIIRRDVPRPKTLPVAMFPGRGVIWSDCVGRAMRN